MINIIAIAYVLISIGSGIDLPSPEMSEPFIYESTAPEFSDNNLDLLCREVYAEAGGDGTDSQKGVTTVIINRIVSLDFPEELEEVLHQSGQFAQPARFYSEEVQASVLEAIEEYGTPDQILPYTCYYFRAHHYHDFGIPYTHYGNTYFSLSEEATD